MKILYIINGSIASVMILYIAPIIPITEQIARIAIIRNMGAILISFIL